MYFKNMYTWVFLPNFRCLVQMIMSNREGKHRPGALHYNKMIRFSWAELREKPL